MRSNKPPTLNKTTANSGPYELKRSDFLPLGLLVLYAVPEWLSGASTSDVMGNQWLMVAVLNTVCLLLFLIKPELPIGSIGSLFRSIIPWILLLTLLIAALSMFTAINLPESLVVYARLFQMVTMAFVISLLLQGRPQLFRWTAVLLSFVLLVQSLQVLKQFFQGINSGETVNSVIYNLKLNAANKNILAAMLVFKSACAIYCAHTARSLWAKIGFSLILLPAALAIFLINARAAYLGLIVVLGAYTLLNLLVRPAGSTNRGRLLSTLFPLLAVSAAFIISGPLLKSAIANDPGNVAYGTVTERISSIDFTAAGSNARILQWKAAVDHIRSHPLTGCGIGNWKLASIPYEREFVDDLFVAYHVHNDFLEITAETGIAGGLCYLAVFAMLFFAGLRVFFNQDGPVETALAIFLLCGAGAYATDAFFNFPLERPSMQFYFALLIAVAVYLCRKDARPLIIKKGKLWTGLLLILLLPFNYVIYQTYRSLKMQALVNKDILSPSPQSTYEDIKDGFPSLPNMNAYTFPIKQVKALYLLNEKKYEQAMELTRSSEKVNPYLSLTEYIKARIYSETNKKDSALLYAKKAFEMKPRAKSHYELLASLLFQKKDTLGLRTVFSEYTRRRNEPGVWNGYIINMINLNADRQNMMQLLDSALKIFPADTSLQRTRTVYQTNNQNNEFYSVFQQGMTAFSARDFNTAIGYFRKAAELDPKQYLSKENIGLCYYSLNRFPEAIQYFQQVRNSKLSTDGKSEFFIGACYISMGKAEMSCSYLQESIRKNYPEAMGLWKKYCH